MERWKGGDGSVCIGEDTQNLKSFFDSIAERHQAGTEKKWSQKTRGEGKKSCPSHGSKETGGEGVAPLNTPLFVKE